MAINTAEKRRSISGVPFFLGGPGVTPNALKDAEWRQESCYSYSGILVAAPPAPPPVIVVAPDVIVPWRPWGPWTPYPVRYEGQATLSARAVLEAHGVVITYQYGEVVLATTGRLSGKAQTVAIAKASITSRSILRLEHVDDPFELEMLGLP